MEVGLYQAVLADARFHQQLLRMDGDIAAKCRNGGGCGGMLHKANFARKPRGKPAGLEKAYDQRFSFCCAMRECRQRATPPSLRFLGRKVYLGVMATVISAMRDGVNARRLAILCAQLGVDRRTVARWRGWWLSTFIATPFWQTGLAAFVPPPDPSQLPASMLERFIGDAEQRLIAFLRFLKPMTGGAAMSLSHAF